MFKYGAIFSNVLATSVMPVLRIESIKLAEKMRKEVIRRIRQQVGLQPPLSPRYAKRKWRYGYGADTLIMTEQYVNSIVVIPTEYGATVGVKNITHWTPILNEKGHKQRASRYGKVRERGYASYKGEKGVPMIKLAEWLEYGTTRAKQGRGGPAAGQPWHIPPRPHWRPAQQKFIRDLTEIRGRLTKAMSDALNRALEAELGPESGRSPAPDRFVNEPETRNLFNLPKNRASKLMNKYKHNEYVKAGVPDPDYRNMRDDTNEE